jgi:Holliday junction DNA helicase RuvA
MAIINGDEKALTQISGIGKKSAQRLILELRDKMNAISKSLAAGGLGGYAPEIRDAVSALVSLGFPESDARNAVSSAAEKMVNPSLQALIKAALAVLKVQ